MDDPAKVSEQAVRVLRVWRHDVLNQVQVASGWAELSRLDLVRSALAETAQRLNDDGRLLALAAPELALAVLAARMDLAEAGVSLELQLPALPIRPPHPAIGALATALAAFGHANASPAPPGSGEPGVAGGVVRLAFAASAEGGTARIAAEMPPAPEAVAALLADRLARLAAAGVSVAVGTGSLELSWRA